MNMNPIKPRIFVGSSSEGLDIARAVQENLADVADVIVWNQGVFDPSDYIVDKLTKRVESFDFGIFVFSFDDTTTMKEDVVKTTRDNVIFELGLFMGVLGCERCYILRPRGSDAKLHMPIDLLGITTAEFNPVDTDDHNELGAALGSACTKIRRSIKDHGRRKDKVDDELVRGTLETFIRAVSVPGTPEKAELRVFLFKKISDHLVCIHHWAPHDVQELEGELKFPINEEWAERTAVVWAAVNKRFKAKEIDPGKQRKLASKIEVSEELCYVMAMPIRGRDKAVWGVVDFDTSNARGKKLLKARYAKSAMNGLVLNLKRIFRIHD